MDAASSQNPSIVEDTAVPGDGQPLADRPENEHRHVPRSPAFRAHIARDWAPRPDTLPERLACAPYAAERRRRLAAQFPGERLVVPAGPLRTRSNDTDYRYRPHSAFAHLTGLGTDQEPDAVLVLEPLDDEERGAAAAAPGDAGGSEDPAGATHEAILYFRPRAERDTEEFYADPRYGELWVGVRPSLAEITALTEISTRHLDEVLDAIAKDAGEDGVPLRVVREADEAITERLDAARSVQEHTAATTEGTERRERTLTADAELARALSELRLVKDSFEIEQMREAIAASIKGFEDIVRALPEALVHARGERVIEGVFARRAREEGYGTGYETIAAAGAHACTLHWIRNDGQVRPGDLVLIDAGVEADSLYTADVTRTLPVDGQFTEAQRRVYEVVREAADAAFAVARPGSKFKDLNDAAQAVIARRLAEWGLLPGTAEESLAEEGQFHRRWIVHGVSHHLGLDVHDCTKARKEMYLDGTIEPGMIFTIEPGLYFSPDDLLAPEELRGIGVRIEDDVLVTADGCENLTAALPREPDAVEAWMADLLRR